MKNIQQVIVCASVLLCGVCDCQLSNIFSVFRQVFENNYITARNNNHNNENALRKSFDFIIVGAGSAGSVLANRLSSNSNWTVLLLEAGKDENFFTDIPLMAAFQSVSGYNWGYKSEKSNSSCLSLENSCCHVLRGRALGGTSVINLLVYSRGNQRDYEEWKNSGNAGWGYDDVLPYFIKSENCSFNVEADGAFRGRNGYLNVEYPSFHTPLRNRFLKTGNAFGYRNTDPNGRFHVGFSKVQATLHNGRRVSSAKAYLRPIRNRPNLYIFTETVVTRILIDKQTKTAYGVELIKNGRKHKVRVKKEVLVAAGAINSPQLLMLSGIGPREDLERLGIPVLRNLKVGYNLQDHVTFVHSFLVNESVTLSDLRVQNPMDVINYVFSGKGPMTIPGGVEALAFLQTNISAFKGLDYPDVEFVLGAGGFNNDYYGSLRHMFGVPSKLFYELYGSVLFMPAFSISTILLKPRSRGRVVIKSANPLQAPAIHLNYFADEYDMRVMAAGMEMARKIGESESFQKYNSTLYHLNLHACKQFNAESYAHRACLARHLATTLGHQVGTCKMGPGSDPDAVVDSQLRVHGVSGLRVVDGSIMPSIVTGHTNSVIMMIGEKASHMITDFWQNMFFNKV